MQGNTFVFFGIAGSGKGTQVKLLQDFLKAKDGKEIVYVYPGSEYRKIIESGTQTASLVKTILDKGGLLPDFLTGSIVANIFVNALASEKHLFFDGYPRTIAQSELLEAAMKFYKRENIKIIYLELTKEEAFTRLKLRGRHDDTKEGIEKRFDEYVNKVIPSMNYFKGKENYEMFTVNGEQSVENVHTDIIKALGF